MQILKSFFDHVAFKKTLFGVRVEVHTSAVILFAGLSVLGQMVMPGATLWMALLFGALAVIGVVVHESGHWLAARRYGVEVTRVQLKWFGGATHHNEVTSRKALVWMALTGVIGNFGVAALCWGIATAIGGGVWSTLLIGGAVFNVSAGALNILPVLPMDGGILIAAILSGRRKLAVGWKRVRSLNIILFLGLAAAALVGLDLMMIMYAALVLLHMWHAGVEPPEDFAQA